MTKTASTVCALLLALGLLPATATAAGDDGPAGGLYGQVAEMVEAQISEEVIRDWLATYEAPLPRPSAQELIRLKAAGASDELLKALIARSQGEEAAPLPQAAGAAQAPSPPATGPAPSPPAQASGPDAAVPVTFRMVYAPRFEDDEDEWDLFVYLDGKPLTYVPAASLLGGADALEIRRSLAPGRHLLRVLQERHVKGRHDRWTHAARAAREELVLGLAPGEPARVELSFKQGLLGFRADGPLSFQAVQGEAVTSVDGVGGYPSDWPLLCEEIEANVPAGERPGRAARRQLEECVRWQDLWGGWEVPPRHEVRRAMEAFDYRPVPKDS